MIDLKPLENLSSCVFRHARETDHFRLRFIDGDEVDGRPVASIGIDREQLRRLRDAIDHALAAASPFDGVDTWTGNSSSP